MPYRLMDVGLGLALAATLGLTACQSPSTGVTSTPSAGTPTTSAPAQPAAPVSGSTGGAATPAPIQAPSAYRVYTVAGDGIRGDADTGVQATQTSLFSPTGVMQAPDGTLYIADYKINKIRKVDPTGVITTIAGHDINPGDAGNEGPAVQATLAKPYAIVTDSHQGLVFSEYGYSVPGTTIPGKVRRIDSAGIIHILAGSGSVDVANGVLATDANLLGPEGLVYDRAGNLYVSEYDGHRVDKIDPTGHLTIVAGTGTAGNDGDGGPATSAHLNSPNWLTLDPKGNLVIVDSGNNDVRVVLSDGTIHTLVGTGVPTNDPSIAGYQSTMPTHLYGDGGLATQATLNTPTTAVYDPSGDLLITDSQNYAVRRVGPMGIIGTIAGTGAAPDASSSTIPDGTTATQVPISLPDGMFINAKGQIFFSEYGGYRVRMLGS